MSKMVIRKVGAGSNVWEWRVSSGRGLSYVCHGQFKTEAEAEAFVAKPAVAEIVSEARAVMIRAETKKEIEDRITNSLNQTFAVKTGQAQALKLGWTLSAVASFFEQNPEKFEDFMKFQMIER